MGLTRPARRIGRLIGTVLSCALMLSLASRGAQAESVWSDLWTTPPQRAQRLLDAGRPDEAARLFRDPKRRAYAELRAGQYAEAAKLLKPFDDAESQYNRGNALARAGTLQAALAAYDASLAKAPHDRDAIHNRDLVARALEREARRSGSGGSQGRRGQSGQQGSGSAGSQSANAGNRGGSSQSGKSQGAGSRGAAGSASGAQAGSQAGRSQPGGESPQQQAEQAREDAELAAQLQREGAKRGSSAEAGGTGTARAGSSSAESVAPPRSKAPGGGDDEGPPLSEQTLALEQWLRRIPDDPGGLLRRKFLIEHLEREQQAQGESPDGDSGGAPQ